MELTGLKMWILPCTPSLSKQSSATLLEALTYTLQLIVDGRAVLEAHFEVGVRRANEIQQYERLLQRKDEYFFMSLLAADRGSLCCRTYSLS